MKNKILLLIGIAPAMLIGCKPTPCADVLFKKDTTIESERKNTLFAFVGEKIEVTDLPYEDGSLDNGVRGKYKILQRVYGCYPGDTIEFSAYFHEGHPEFSRYKNVLLFVSKIDSEYYHEKYQYNDVYMTRSGKWAGPYLWEDHYERLDGTIPPQRMDFIQNVSYPLSDTILVGEYASYRFPHPFFWTVGDSAIAQYGNYVEELFKIKKEGVLTYRGLFGVPELPIPVEAQDVELEEVPPPRFEETDERFITFWDKVTDAGQKKGIYPMQNLLPDSFWVCGSLFSRQKFMQECNTVFFDSIFHTQWKRWEVDYPRSDPIDLSDLPTSARKRIVKEKDGYCSIRIQLIKSDIVKQQEYAFYLSFIETKQGFKIYDIRFVIDCSCCFWPQKQSDR